MKTFPIGVLIFAVASWLIGLIVPGITLKQRLLVMFVMAVAMGVRRIVEDVFA